MGPRGGMRGTTLQTFRHRRYGYGKLLRLVVIVVVVLLVLRCCGGGLFRQAIRVKGCDYHTHGNIQSLPYRFGCGQFRRDRSNGHAVIDRDKGWVVVKWFGIELIEPLLVNNDSSHLVMILVSFFFDFLISKQEFQNCNEIWVICKSK